DRPGGNRSPQVIRAEFLSQKLGRWTIGYCVTEGEPEVIGKMFKDPARGRRSHQTMQWLWDHAFAVPRPLGFLPELSMLVYQPVPGRPLGNGLFDDGAAADMDLAAAWLAALHRSTLPLDRSFDVEHFCAYLRLLGCRVPAMALTLGRRRDEFIAAYRCRSDCDLGQRYGMFYAYTCLKIAKQLCMHSGVAPRPNGKEEYRQTA